MRKAKPARKRKPIVAAPKFEVGARVIVDFNRGGRVHGFTKKECRRPGFVEMHKGRFMNSPDFAEINYVIRLDEPFCQVERWVILEGSLSLESGR